MTIIYSFGTAGFDCRLNKLFLFMNEGVLCGFLIKASPGVLGTKKFHPTTKPRARSKNSEQ